MFDEQKTHQDPRRAEKPAQLRSETPTGVRQELDALSLAHFVIRSLLFEAARPLLPLGLAVDRLSFVNCFRILQCRLPECDSRSAASLEAWYHGGWPSSAQNSSAPAAIASTPASSNEKCPSGPKNAPTTESRSR